MMEKVTGIGCLFFRARTAALARWYQDNPIELWERA